MSSDEYECMHYCPPAARVVDGLAAGDGLGRLEHESAQGVVVVPFIMIIMNMIMMMIMIMMIIMITEYYHYYQCYDFGWFHENTRHAGISVGHGPSAQDCHVVFVVVVVVVVVAAAAAVVVAVVVKARVLHKRMKTTVTHHRALGRRRWFSMSSSGTSAGSVGPGVILGSAHLHHHQSF